MCTVSSDHKRWPHKAYKLIGRSSNYADNYYTVHWNDLWYVWWSNNYITHPSETTWNLEIQWCKRALFQAQDPRLFSRDQDKQCSCSTKCFNAKHITWCTHVMHIIIQWTRIKSKIEVPEVYYWLSSCSYVTAFRKTKSQLYCSTVNIVEISAA